MFFLTKVCRHWRCNILIFKLKTQYSVLFGFSIHTTDFFTSSGLRSSSTFGTTTFTKATFGRGPGAGIHSNSYDGRIPLAGHREVFAHRGWSLTVGPSGSSIIATIDSLEADWLLLQDIWVSAHLGARSGS